MRKILVRAPQWLGDAVVSTVFLSRLKNRFPEASISVLNFPVFTPLYQSHPDVTETIPLGYPDGKTIFDAARAIQEKEFDAVFILPRSFRTAAEAWLAKVPQRIGFAGDGRRFLLTEAVPYDSKLLYPHRYLKLIGEETLPLESVRPHFPSEEPSPEKKSKLALGSLKKPVLGMAPASVAPSRTWEAERFIEVANRFQKERGGTVVLFGSSTEKEVTARVRSGIHGTVIDTVGQLDLPELGWLMSQCDFLLANDSGLMHVAACFNVPTAVPFGPSDPTFAVPPWGKFSWIQHTEISCVPCLRNHCVRFGRHHNECLKSISPSEMLETLVSVSKSQR
jgi:heptosyltransferase-2